MSSVKKAHTSALNQIIEFHNLKVRELKSNRKDLTAKSDDMNKLISVFNDGKSDNPREQLEEQRAGIEVETTGYSAAVSFLKDLGAKLDVAAKSLENI